MPTKAALDFLGGIRSPEMLQDIGAALGDDPTLLDLPEPSGRRQVAEALNEVTRFYGLAFNKPQFTRAAEQRDQEFTQQDHEARLENILPVIGRAETQRAEQKQAFLQQAADDRAEKLRDQQAKRRADFLLMTQKLVIGDPALGKERYLTGKESSTVVDHLDGQWAQGQGGNFDLLEQALGGPIRLKSPEEIKIDSDERLAKIRAGEDDRKKTHDDAMKREGWGRADTRAKTVADAYKTGREQKATKADAAASAKEAAKLTSDIERDSRALAKLRVGGKFPAKVQDDAAVLIAGIKRKQARLESLVSAPSSAASPPWLPDGADDAAE